jgi:hypothetical protein
MFNVSILFLSEIIKRKISNWKCYYRREVSKIPPESYAGKQKMNDDITNYPLTEKYLVDTREYQNIEDAGKKEPSYTAGGNVD